MRVKGRQKEQALENEDLAHLAGIDNHQGDTSFKDLNDSTTTRGVYINL